MRRWHVEHRDGREWTFDEVSNLGIPFGHGHVSAHGFLIDECGNPVLVNDGLCVFSYAEDASDGDARADMVVVFDE